MYAQPFAVYMATTEGSHHARVITTVRITNSGKILSYWFWHPKTKKLIHVNLEEEE